MLVMIRLSKNENSHNGSNPNALIINYVRRMNVCITHTLTLTLTLSYQSVEIRLDVMIDIALVQFLLSEFNK